MALAYFPCGIINVSATHDHRNLWATGTGPFYVGTSDHTGSDVHYTLRFEFTTDEWSLDYYTVRLKLFAARDSHIETSSEFRYAICAAANDDLYVHAHGVVSDNNQVGGGKVGVLNVYNPPFDVNESATCDIICSSNTKLLPNTTYYMYLWDLEYLQITDVIPGDSDSSGKGDGNSTIVTEMLPGWTLIEGLTISAAGDGYVYRHTVEIGAEAGFVFIEDTSSFNEHQVFIEDGAKYDQYIAYLDTGTRWDIFN